MGQWYLQNFVRHQYQLTDSFNHLLRAEPSRSALFEKWNNFSGKTFKTTGRLEGCSIPNALNLKILEGKIHNCTLLLNFPALFSLYRTYAMIF